MFIELSEALVCPACGPPQGLVVVVDRLDGRRVRSGFLGCPICEARYPIRDGVVHLSLSEPSEGAPGAAVAPHGEAPDRRDAEEVAVLIAALFDVRDGRGYLLLDEAVAPVAARVSELTGGCEVIALTGDEDSGDPLAPGTNQVTGAGGRFPVHSGRVRALAMGRQGDDRVRDAIRALGPEGRLVVVSPLPETRKLLAELSIQPLADEATAFLGVVTAPRE